MTPCTCNTDMGDTCPACAPKRAPVVLVASGEDFDFPDGTMAVWGADDLWYCNNSGPNGSGLSHVGPTFATAKEAAAAIGALLPPKVGDKWGDLSPEQRAMVPVGSELGATRSGAYLLDTDYWITKHADGWHHPSPNFPRPSQDSNVAAARRITRLGPAAEPEAPAEVDRSGWPVLVKRGGEYIWPNGMYAIVYRSSGVEFNAWHDGGLVMAGVFSNPLAAADAIRARLPDEAPTEDESVTPSEAAEIEQGAALDAIRAIVRLGHTDHCAKRLAWGDGECECGASEPNRALHPATSALLGTLAGLDEDDVLNAIYNLERESNADLDTAVYAWLDAGSPDAGNDILFGEAEIATLRARAAAAESTLSTLRGQLAFLVPGGEVTDAAIVAAAKALADHANADGQDDTLLTAGLGLLDQAALGNPTLGYIAMVIRRGVGRG